MPSRLLPLSRPGSRPVVVALLGVIAILTLALSVALGIAGPDAETLGAAVRWNGTDA